MEGLYKEDHKGVNRQLILGLSVSLTLILVTLNIVKLFLYFYRKIKTNKNEKTYLFSLNSLNQCL